MEEVKSIRLPNDYLDSGNDVMSNADHEIDSDVVAQIKGKKLYAGYPGWNFYGYVWFDEKWHCEVWVYNHYKKTFISDTLEEIMSEVSSKYGHD